MAHTVQDTGEPVTVEFNRPARMRDGVTLCANIYRPAGQGPWPVLLARTPYDKNDMHNDAWCGLDPVQTAQRGFIVAIQDVRGRFASEGKWEPLKLEAQDGYDTVEWVASLAGSNGRVAMYSGSYCGNTQWLAAAMQPPSLRAISPAMTWSEPTDGLLSRGGALELGLALRWALETGVDCVRRLRTHPDEIQRRTIAVTDELDALESSGYWELPANNNPVLHRHRVPSFGGYRTIQSSRAAEWGRVADRYDKVEVPSLHTAGWYDIFVQGTLENYMAMSVAGHEARLVVGPWTHESHSDPIGGRLFGQRGARDGSAVHAQRDWRDLQLDWFRCQLNPVPSAKPVDAPVRIFVMGRNEWRDETAWPLSRATRQRWFLHSDGTLNRGTSEGIAQSRVFTYDPVDPVPTIGGNGVPSGGYSAGPIDQTSIEVRGDVLSFTSEPMTVDLEVTGKVSVVLYAESSAPSTDWVARLCDVHADGRSFNLCDGIIRVVRGANQRQRYEIDLWSTSNVFRQGHRIRVHITSSSFPRWDRNLNTGHQAEARHQIAHQRIFTGTECPSHVSLPVVT